MVQYQLQMLERHLCTVMDHLLVLPGGRRLAGPDPIAEVERMTGLSLAPSLEGIDIGHALLVAMGDSPEVHLIELAPRRTAHVRHWHKYVQGKLPGWLQFNFTGKDGRAVSSAANVQEFCDLVTETPTEPWRFMASASISRAGSAQRFKKKNSPRMFMRPSNASSPRIA